MIALGGLVPIIAHEGAFSRQVKIVLEVGEAVMEALSLHAVADRAEVFILSTQLGDDCMLISFQLCPLLMVAVGSLNMRATSARV